MLDLHKNISKNISILDFKPAFETFELGNECKAGQAAGVGKF